MPRLHPLLLLALALGQSPAPSPLEAPRVVPVYYVPRDLDFGREALALQIRALDDVRAWYARRLGGQTFRAEPIIVQRSRHTFAELAGADFQNWWPLPDAEFASYGMPWNRQSRIKLLILARGGGAWAGADSENGGIDSVAQAGRVPKGDLGGLAVIGDSSTSGLLAGVCPRESPEPASWRKPTGGTAWWCNWNTYRGTIAHELGHTWGLPHPDAFRTGFRCDSTAITNMQCHWAWPADSLLPYEATHLRSLAHFRAALDSEYVMLAALRAHAPPGALRAAIFERGDSLLWIAGRGAGTGYPWGVALRSSGGHATATFVLPPRAAWLVADVGRPPGDTGVVRLSLRAAGRPLFAGEVGANTLPLRLALPLREARELKVEVEGGGCVVMGNARVYPQR